MKKNINGVRHKLILLKVEERDELGRPSRVTCGYDDTVFDIEGGEDFVTAWVPDDAVKTKNRDVS